MRVARLAAVIAAAALGMALLTASAAPGQSWTIDFEGLAEGSTPGSLSVGSGISGPGSLGGSVGLSSDGGVTHPAMIFDSDCTGLPDCSGGDDDLGVQSGNVLIISEDGDSGDPDDDSDGATGGTPIEVTFDFSALGTVCVSSVTVVDIEATSTGEFTVSGPALAVTSIAQPETGDAGTGTVAIGYCGVDTLTWQPEQSGAIDNIEFSRGDRWMTGGGVIFETEGRGRSAELTYFTTHGFIIRCDGSHANFEYNDHLEGLIFHLESVESVLCVDNNLSPQPPATDFDTLTLIGFGRVNGESGHMVEVTLTDTGQPAVNDEITIEIYNLAGDAVIHFATGMLDVGNHQAH
jgi:hypothetical protein